MTTFTLEYAGGYRQLWLRHRARALAIGDIPADWMNPSVAVAYVGPVAGECDGAFVRALPARFVGIGLQGWLRRTGADGRVEPARLPDVPEIQAPPRLDVAIVSELDHPGVEDFAALLAAGGATAAITRGARGATLIRSSESVEVPAAAAREVDPTGAGDVFGVVLTLELARGATLAAAGRAAAEAAARVVEGPGLGTLSAHRDAVLGARAHER
jgi:sugar/nucleoside kinase (ribokinase family)